MAADNVLSCAAWRKPSFRDRLKRSREKGGHKPGHAPVLVERGSSELLGRLSALTDRLEAKVKEREQQLREQGEPHGEANA